MENAKIIFSVDGYIARIVLNNPEKHNSLGENELVLLQRYLEEIANSSEIRVLVLTGAGDKTFCAGAALGELGAGEIDGDFVQQTSDQLAALKVPTICEINGNIYGGGVELALSCDFRIGVSDATMRVPAAKLGLCYPLSGINRFVAKLGVNMAKRILVAAEQFSAEEMHRLGFLDYLVDRNNLQASVYELAHSISGLAPLAVQGMNQLLHHATSGEVNEELAQELSRRCVQSADFQEGLAAQMEKRAPKFEGN
mgnify:CR=1 FL=1